MVAFKTIKPFSPIVDFTLFMDGKPVQLLRARDDRHPEDIRLALLLKNIPTCYPTHIQEIDVRKGNWLEESA